MNVTRFEFWEKQGQEMTSPFWGAKITPSSVFLRQAISSPMLSVEQWDIFPTAKALEGFIRHRFLPYAFGEWRIRDKWDKHSERILPLETILNCAEAAKDCRYNQDIPLMRGLTRQLDEAISEDDDGVMAKRLMRLACSFNFNKRWDTTGASSFELHVFVDPQTIAWTVFKRLTKDSTKPEEEFHDRSGITKSEWCEVCANLYGSSGNQKTFKHVLKVDFSG
jgi:hypothetical protein